MDTVPFFTANDAPHHMSAEEAYGWACGANAVVDAVWEAVPDPDVRALLGEAVRRVSSVPVPPTGSQS